MSDEEGPAGAAPHHHMSDEEAIASTVKMALVDSPYVDKETAAWVRKGGKSSCSHCLLNSLNRSSFLVSIVLLQLPLLTVLYISLNGLRP